MRKGKGWYATFAVLVIGSFVAIYALTGEDAIGAAGRFIWNGLVLVANAVMRSAGSALKVVAQGVGWRRLSRLMTATTSVSLGYAAGVVASDSAVEKARGWRGKLHGAAEITRTRWQELPLIAKLLAVGGLVASQVYLHFLLIIFPIAFLVPVVRRLWVRGIDVLFGSWYWKTFGSIHRAVVARLEALPLVSPAMAGVRLLRLRYLCAWRLWRYHPRYRDPASNARAVDLVEPLRLWWRGELDAYVGRPLLAGSRDSTRYGRELPELLSPGGSGARSSVH